MEVTRLSSKEQVIILKSLRTAYQWEAGQDLVAIDFGDGVLLKPKKLSLKQQSKMLQVVCPIRVSLKP